MMTLVDQITQWSILGVAVLATVYGLALTFSARPTGAQSKLARGFFIWPNSVSAVLAVVTIGVLGLSGRIASDMLAYVLAAVAGGYVLLHLLFQASRVTGRKLATEGGGAEEARVGYNLLSGSGFLLCSSALLGLGVFAVIQSTWQTAMLQPLMALVLGFWLAITFWSLPSALYRWLLNRESESTPVQTAPLCVQFRSTPGEMAFLAATALASAIAISLYRFWPEDLSGRLYPLGVFAAAIFFGALAGRLLAPPAAGRSGRRIAVRSLGMLVFLGGTGLAAYYLAVESVVDLNAFYCFGVGLGTAMLLMLTARYRPPFVPVGSPFGLEIAVAEALMLLASAVLAFRWMAGYGIALCAVGLLSSFAVLFPVGALWAAGRTDDDSETDLSFMAHAASRYAEILIAGGAFLLVVAVFRIFTERAGLQRAGIDITDPYPLVGLVIGASFPILLRALSQSGWINARAITVERSVLIRLGRYAALRTFGIWLLAVLTPLAVAFFWRIEAAGAFLVGLAAAELFLILTLWLGEVRNTADESIRLATRSTHVLAVGSALIAVTFVPPLIEATGSLTRAAKIQGLIGVFAVLFILVLATVWQRLKMQKC